MVTIRKISIKDYPIIDIFIEKNLYTKKRPRTYRFLLNKLKAYPDLFLSLYSKDMLIGVVQGFPRDDYLLLSEIAVDKNQRNKGYGSMLLKCFEKAARKSGYKKIKLGSRATAVRLYLKNNYSPSLLIQVYRRDSSKVLDFLKKEKVISVKRSNGLVGIELSVDKVDLSELRSLKRRLKPLSIQYLFTKNI